MIHIEIQNSDITIILEAEHSLASSFHPVYLYVSTTLTGS